MKLVANWLFAMVFSLTALLPNRAWAADPEYIYLIQVASHADPQYDDFKNIRSIGYLYTSYAGKNMYRIMMGIYNSRSHADQKLAQVRAKGFKDAFITREELKEEDAVYIVQVATLDQDEAIYWGDWQKLDKDLCAQLSETKIRIAYGPYKTQDEANAKMAELKGRAPQDMFVKKVSGKTVHTISEFEMEASKGQSTKPVSRLSIKALQQQLQTANYFKGTVDGMWGNETRVSHEAYKAGNENYLKYAALAKDAQFGKKIEEGSLQYYINLIGSKPYTADEGLKAFKHPLAKVYRAYMYLNGDVPNQKGEVNALMNEAISMVFGNYKGQTRYDFTMKYAYEDLEQLVKHLRAIHEAVKDEPDFPCWLFQRHPKIVAVAFAPYWNNDRDKYAISSDCGSYFQVSEMKVLMTIAKDFAASPNEYEKNSAALQELFLKPVAQSAEQAKALEAWNEKLWKGLEQWSMGSPLQMKLYQTLRFAYYDALRVLEDPFLAKGYSAADARAIGLQVLKLSVGCSLDEYCGKE